MPGQGLGPPLRELDRQLGMAQTTITAPPEISHCSRLSHETPRDIGRLKSSRVTRSQVANQPPTRSFGWRGKRHATEKLRR